MLNDEAIREIQNRAWQATCEGRYEDARRIYVEELDPLDAPMHIAEFQNQAVLYLLMGDLTTALFLFRKARGLPSPPAIPIPFVGAVLWMQGSQEDACKDWAYEIERRRSGIITHSDGAGGVEVPALLWWASAHSGFEGWRKLAEQELKRRGRTKYCQNSGWPGPLVPYLLGQNMEPIPSNEMLLQRAATYLDHYPETNFRYVCQANFYCGASCLVKGDNATYLLYMEQVVAAPSFTLDKGNSLRLFDPEFHLARAVLQNAKGKS